jgi:glycogen debranching enzyme
VHLNLSDTLVIKRENLFLVAPRDGDLPAQRHPLGLWYRDCRFLSAHRLRLNGEPALLLQASDALGTRALHELTNPELPLADGETLPAQSLSLRIERSLADEPGRLVERILVRNHHPGNVSVTLDLSLGADFEPMLAVRGLVERPERPAVEAAVDGRTMRWWAHGRDGVVRTTSVELSDPPAPADGDILRFQLDLPVGGEHELELRIAVHEGGEARAGARPPRRPPPPQRTQVRSDDELFDRILARSLQDLDLLRSELDGQSYFAAGIPWFATLFGRDSLITAMEALSFWPRISEETLRLLGGLLGRELDDDRDEEPGRVLHELRVGEPAALGETPFARYYGSADATPLWLCLLADHADWSGSLNLFRELRPQVDAALGWIDHHGDLDGDGLVEYRRRSPHGLENQGWRDSPDGVPDAGGRPLAPPVALVEVQGYVARALRRVADLFELDGDAARAERLRRRSATTEAALERFWLEGASGYAIGLDGDKRPGSCLTSNQGHLLWAGAVPAARAAAVRELLMSEPMFSGWGVRTLADPHPGFNPVGYHTGSVWPHDNALIASGLRRYGFDEDFLRIFEGMLEAASQFAGYSLPELFGGYASTPRESPVPYPVACRPQAWAAGSIPYLLTWGLGLRPEGLARRLRIVRPSLPRWLDRIEVVGLRVADAAVDLRFERTPSGVQVADVRIDGRLDVVTETAGQPPLLADA